MKKLLYLIPTLLFFVGFFAWHTYSAQADIYGSTSLLGWWTLDNGRNGSGAGGITDTSGNGADGTQHSSPTVASAIFSQGLKFNGTTQYVETPATLPLMTGAITITGWMNRPWTTAKYAPLGADDTYFASSTGKGISFMTTGSATQDWQSKDFLCTGNGAPSSANPRAIAAPGTLADNTWHMMTCVLSSGVAQLYLDGRALSMRVSVAAAIPSENSQWQIGSAARGLGDFTDGTIDDERVYNRALSAAEIQALYYMGLAQHQTGNY